MKVERNTLEEEWKKMKGKIKEVKDRMRKIKEERKRKK